MRTMTILLAGALLLSGAGLALAEGKGKDDKQGDDHGRRDGHGPRFEKHGDRMIFHNDQIAVLFHQNKNHAAPDLRVVFNQSADDEKAGYRVKILSLYEASRNDTGRSLARINLARADDWNVQTVEGNGTMDLTMVRSEAQGIVTLVFHLDTLNSSVKFDVGVDNWRWANATDDVLILDMLVQGHDLRNETGAAVSVADAGYVRWAQSADATYGNDTRAIGVSAFQGKVKDDDEKADKDDDKGGHLYLVFNGTGGYSRLAYDPELGVQSSDAQTKGTPFVAPMVAVVGLAGLALALRRRG